MITRVVALIAVILRPRAVCAVTAPMSTASPTAAPATLATVMVVAPAVDAADSVVVAAAVPGMAVPPGASARVPENAPH